MKQRNKETLEVTAFLVWLFSVTAISSMLPEWLGIILWLLFAAAVYAYCKR